MEELLDRLIESERFDALLTSHGRRVARVPEPGHGYAAAALARAVGAPVLVVAPGRLEAERIADTAELFLPTRAAVFPAWEALPYEGISPSPEVSGRRGFALHAARVADGPYVLVAPAVAAMQALVPTLGQAEPLRLEPGDEPRPRPAGRAAGRARVRPRPTSSSIAASSPSAAASSTSFRRTAPARFASSTSATRSSPSARSSPPPRSRPPA